MRSYSQSGKDGTVAERDGCCPDECPGAAIRTVISAEAIAAAYYPHPRRGGDACNLDIPQLTAVIPPLHGHAVAGRQYHIYKWGAGSAGVAEHHAGLGPCVRVLEARHVRGKDAVAGPGLIKKVELIIAAPDIRAATGNSPLAVRRIVRG